MSVRGAAVLYWGHVTRGSGQLSVRGQAADRHAPLVERGGLNQRLHLYTDTG